jgi:hypothetical protein
MSVWFILAAMIFLHIIDDYVLQAPCLSNLKQKSFWEKNAPDEQYKFDYIVALIMHAFSWSFMIMLPIAFAVNFNVGGAFLLSLLINTIIHAVTDNLKANKKVINLWVDQATHIMQIFTTAAIFNMGGF